MQITTMEDAITAYKKIEDSLTRKAEAFALSTVKEKAAMEQLTVFMRATLNQQGVASMNVPGVAEIKIVNKRTFGCADWDTLYTWIVVNNKPELLIKRLHEANTQHYVDENGGNLPPAVNVHTEAVLKILKPK